MSVQLGELTRITAIARGLCASARARWITVDGVPVALPADASTGVSAAARITERASQMLDEPDTETAEMLSRSGEFVTACWCYLRATREVTGNSWTSEAWEQILRDRTAFAERRSGIQLPRDVLKRRRESSAAAASSETGEPAPGTAAEDDTPHTAAAAMPHG